MQVNRHTNAQLAFTLHKCLSRLEKMILFGQNCLTCLAVAFSPSFTCSKSGSNKFNALAKHDPFRDIHNSFAQVSPLPCPLNRFAYICYMFFSIHGMSRLLWSLSQMLYGCMEYLQRLAEKQLPEIRALVTLSGRSCCKCIGHRKYSSIQPADVFCHLRFSEKNRKIGR